MKISGDSSMSCLCKYDQILNLLLGYCWFEQISISRKAMRQNIGDVTWAVRINRAGVCKTQLLNKLLWVLTMAQVMSVVLYNLAFCPWVIAVTIVVVAGLYWVLCRVSSHSTHIFFWTTQRDRCSFYPHHEGAKENLSNGSKLTYLADGGSRCIQLFFSINIY